MKKLALASALAGALALTACKLEEKSKSPDLSKEEIAAQADIALQARIDRYVIEVKDVPVTRNGENFTVSADAFCNTVPQNDDMQGYTEVCTSITVKSIQTQFACAGYSLPAAMTKSYNENIIKAGIQGTYDPRYLYTEDRLKASISANDRSIFKEDYIILTEISDLEAAKRTYLRDGDKPEFCPALP